MTFPLILLVAKNRVACKLSIEGFAKAVNYELRCGNTRSVRSVEPLSTYLENWKAPTSAVTRYGDTIYVSGFPPFDPDTGKVIEAPIERQTELVLKQMKLCLETAGSSLENVLKCNVYLHVGREIRCG